MSDRIDRRVKIRASRDAVWRAVSEAELFGRWFGVRFDGAFRAGAQLRGRICPTEVDPEVAKLQAPHAGAEFDFEVATVEPMREIAFRWRPNGVSQSPEARNGPMTRIVFRLRAEADGVELSISEIGFDQLSEPARSAAHASSSAGWTHQADLVRRFVEAGAAAAGGETSDDAGR